MTDTFTDRLTSPDYYRVRLRTWQVPEELHDGLIAYILHGAKPGSFLTAVLVNSLKDACAKSDTTNRYRLYDIVAFLYNDIPMAAWGDPDRVFAWCRHRGMEFTEPEAE